MGGENKSIGILGGTFDPVHYGHLRSAQEAKQALGLDEIRLLPCFQPVHRTVPAANSKQRIEMMHLALEEFPELILDPREILREGPSYTVDTLESIRAEAGDQASLHLLLGTDAFAGLPDWYRWSRLLELTNLVVLQRPGSELPSSGILGELLRQRVVPSLESTRESPCGIIRVVKLVQLDVSASRVRAALAGGAAPKGLLPESVLDYIFNKGLYGTGNR